MNSTKKNKQQTRRSAPDVLVRNEGTVYLFCPLTSAANEWLRAHVQSDATWFAHALVVEQRYVCGLVEGLREAGFRLA